MINRLIAANCSYTRYQVNWCNWNV